MNHTILLRPYVLALLVLLTGVSRLTGAPDSRPAVLDEWRSVSSASIPSVYVRNNHARFYFQTQTNQVGFSAHWSRSRVPTDGYRVHTARLHLDPELSRAPRDEDGWRAAVVIAGDEWRQLSTSLLAALTPAASNHGSYYQGLLENRLLYRDAQGQPHSTSVSEPPGQVQIERHFSMQETLETLARLLEQELAQTHPQDSLFVLIAPDARRFPQPLLLDRQRRQCVWLAPATLYDPTERGFSLAVTARGISALLFQSHGVALVKNPFSSATRLCDLGVQTLGRFLRLPLLRPGSQPPPLALSEGMDLVGWERWLDAHTGTRLQDGSMELLVDGEKFFPRLEEAIASATNHIHMDLFIFDRDDIGVQVADQLKQRSGAVEVKIVMDQMGSLAAGNVPPATPMPENFVGPASIHTYLETDSKVRVRPFLNPWFSADHSKVYLVDGAYAWLGGMNIGREYRYEWHDLMVELHGPVVASLESEFRRRWAHEGPAGDLGYMGAWLTPRKVPSFPSQPWIQLRLLPTKTAWKPFSTAVLGAIDKARRYIYVENPYLIDKRVVVGLVRARNRGVDVRVVLPRVNDFKSVSRSNLVLANYLLAHRVGVFFYPGMTHVKALLADDWACVGSGNLNDFSLRLCQEQNVATSDPVFCRQLKEELFDKDFAHSFELTESIAVAWSDFLADLLLEGF